MLLGLIGSLDRSQHQHVDAGIVGAVRISALTSFGKHEPP